MTVTKDQLTSLYLAYFGRPPDFEGLSFYLGEEVDIPLPLDEPKPKETIVIGIVMSGIDASATLMALEAMAIKQHPNAQLAFEVKIVDVGLRGGFGQANLAQMPDATAFGYYPDQASIVGAGSSDWTLSRTLSRALKETLDVKVYANDLAYESGLSRQAPGYGSSRLSAKALRRQAMKPRGSRGR